VSGACEHGGVPFAAASAVHSRQNGGCCWPACIWSQNTQHFGDILLMK
jgi:hypothetical protein